MDLDVTCPHCSKQYLVKAKFAGRKVKCRNCRQGMLVRGPGDCQLDGGTEDMTDPLLNTLFEYRIPSEEDTKESFDWMGPSDWQPPRVKVECDECGQTYQAPEELSGRRVRCRCCGSSIRVPEAESPTVTMEL